MEAAPVVCNHNGYNRDDTEMNRMDASRLWMNRVLLSVRHHRHRLHRRRLLLDLLAVV